MDQAKGAVSRSYLPIHSVDSSVGIAPTRSTEALPPL